MIRHLLALALVGGCAAAETLPDDGVPQVVQVGAGSYASRPPRDQNKRPGLPGKAGWGDDSQIFSRMRLYVDPAWKGPVPSTDWWTSVVSKRWSGDLWAYPAVVRAVPAGVEIGCPRTWDIAKDGKTARMVAASRLLVGGVGFVPLHAEAAAWSDWMVRVRMPDAAGRSLSFTTAHGNPFTTIECDRIDPVVAVGQAELFGPGAKAASDRLGVEVAGDVWGVYAPAGTRFTANGGRIACSFAGTARWLAIAPLPASGDLDRFAAQAGVVPRSTRVAWQYRPAEAVVATTWTVEAEDLDGRGRGDVMQGWIPHHYQPPARPGFTTDGPRFATPRGELRCAVGRRFEIRFPFTGLLPEYPAPAEGIAPEPFRPAVMQQLIRDHLGRPGYGSETYWGGKKVLLLARYMELARQMGMAEETAVFRDRAAEAVRDWLTFTPGEGEHFFAWYPNWGSLVGCRSRDNANPGVDVLQDHHMCYGYHVYAAALLMLQDGAFAKAYGPMARLVAKDYAEWDEKSELFGRFRNLDPWCGHSWSGGMGSDDGNGQESSSEAMQGYGAMFLLGEALGDTAMRDAAAFCWATEARGIAEYYFDRGHRNFPAGWKHPMITNIQTEGLGWWTWFSGNPFWMHAIQWLPMSPLLSYLGEDPAYAKADWESMWATHEGGKGWDGYLGTDTGVSNIAMNYLSIVDPAEAAKVFHGLADRGMGGVKGAEAGPTYWRIHALRRLGPQRFDAWTDVATSQAFGVAGASPSFAVYNATDAPREVRCFVAGKQVATFTAPPRRLSVMRDGKVAVDAGAMPSVPPAAAKAAELPLSDGCAATASSAQGREGDPERAVDGDPATRWTSAASDGEWLAVDLGRRCRLERVALQWEAAYGKDYDLQGSDDGKTWTTLAELRNRSGGREEVAVAGEARHVRMLGRKRGTGWGWSLFAFEVYGAPAGTAGRRLVVEPALAQISDRQTAHFTAVLVDAAGTRTPVTPAWQVRGRGSIAADGTFTPQGGATFDQPRVAVIAEADGVRGQAAAVVEETLRVATVAITPGNGPIRLGVGDTLEVSAEASDQFKARIAQAPALSASGSVTLQGGTLKAAAIGRATVTASLGGQSASLAVEVVPPDQVDIAAGCPATCSSAVNDGSGADKAFDRDPKTRWESRHSDPQWIAVDLGKVRALGRMVLRWEGAHAKVWILEASDDGTAWRQVAKDDDCRGGEQTVPLDRVSCRHLRLTCVKRAGGYGNSLFSVEVYPASR